MISPGSEKRWTTVNLFLVEKNKTFILFILQNFVSQKKPGSPQYKLWQKLLIKKITKKYKLNKNKLQSVSLYLFKACYLFSLDNTFIFGYIPPLCVCKYVELLPPEIKYFLRKSFFIFLLPEQFCNIFLYNRMPRYIYKIHNTYSIYKRTLLHKSLFFFPLVGND